MRTVEPKFKVIGQTKLNRDAVVAYLIEMVNDLDLDTVTGFDFVKFMEQHADVDDLTLLTEVMGRVCYRSWAPGMNPNVTKVRSDTHQYILNLIDSGHGSVFEHASINFVFWNVSRVFTHELVRHRVGTAISQESMRYVRLNDIPIWLPLEEMFEQKMEEASEFYKDVEEVLLLMERKQEKWATKWSLDDAATSFNRKKINTSFLRRFFSPTGVATQMGWTCNVRELRWIIKQRTSLGAEAEMIEVFNAVLKECVGNWPMLFGDLVTAS